MKKQIDLEGWGCNRVMALVVVSCFLGGGILGGVITILIMAQQSPPRPAALRESDISTAQSGYTFIDPLLALKNNTDLPMYNAMKAQLAAYISAQEQNSLRAASVYFRDINEPGGFVLNPSEKYTPASLNKVPVMMAYYRIAETNPAILDVQILYSGQSDHNRVEEIKSAVQLVPGTAYSVQRLIEHMIRNSDNNAADLLQAYLKTSNQYQAYLSVFSDLGIDPTVVENYTDNMTAEQYSIFLRTLYNATYLNRADSERALRLLSETDFSEGIESGVPNSVLVAQKFGEVRMTDAQGNLLGKQINNCGIIYFPQHPYLLCVMTKAQGDDIKSLEAVIAVISRIIYQNMEVLYS